MQDVSWEPTAGKFLLSVGTDQTTRAWAPLLLEGEGSAGKEGVRRELTWREVARPQIHGYDMKCVHMLSPILFVSGADEKVRLSYLQWSILIDLCTVLQLLRVFHSPRIFVDDLQSVSRESLDVVSIKESLFVSRSCLTQ